MVGFNTVGLSLEVEAFPVPMTCLFQRLSPLLQRQLNCVQKCSQITTFCNRSRISPDFIVEQFRNGWMDYFISLCGKQRTIIKTGGWRSPSVKSAYVCESTPSHIGGAKYQTSKENTNIYHGISCLQQINTGNQKFGCMLNFPSKILKDQTNYKPICIGSVWDGVHFPHSSPHSTVFCICS